MAKIHELPPLGVIKGLKGVLDFYLWKGIPCVRRWPHIPPAHRTQPSLDSAHLFAAVVKGYALVGGAVKDLYAEDAKDHPRTARDLYVSGVLGHLHEVTPPPPEPEMFYYKEPLHSKTAGVVSMPGQTFHSDSPAVGDVWVVTNIKCRNNSRATTRHLAFLVSNGDTTPLYDIDEAITGGHFRGTDAWCWLEEGDFIRVHFFTSQAGDNCEVGLVGHIMAEPS